MIPKVIHYCWVGPHQKSAEMLSCIESWKKHNPDFSIIEWNESNFDIQSHPFTKKMYAEKKWAFVSDYMRLSILEEQGGIYLDTDMLILQSLSPLCNVSCILGRESKDTISAGMIGATVHHPFIQSCKKFYDDHPEKTNTIPRVLTHVYDETKDKDLITVYPPETFYPFDAEHIKQWHGQDLGSEVYGVHLWAYTWGSPLNKLFKKIGIYTVGKKLTEHLGIKKFLKRIFGFI